MFLRPRNSKWNPSDWLYHTNTDGKIVLDGYINASPVVSFPSPSENFLISQGFFFRYYVVSVDFNNVLLESDDNLPVYMSSPLDSRVITHVYNLPPNITIDSGWLQYTCITKVIKFGYNDVNNKGCYFSTYKDTKIQHASHLHPEPKNLIGTFQHCKELIDGGDLQKSVRLMHGTFQECSKMKKGVDTKFAYKLLAMLNVYVNCYSLLETGTFSDNIHYLDFTFIKCSSLIKIEELPKSLISMVYAFSGCTSLQVVPDIPESVKYMTGAFRGCSSIKYPMKKLPSGLLEADELFRECAQLRKGVDVPDSVVSAVKMYAGCTWLKKGVYIGRSVQDTSDMYYNCISLKSSPDIPDNVLYCNYMFYCCRMLKHPPKLSKNTYNMSSMFQNCVSMMDYPEIPENVSIMDNAFAGCDNVCGTLIIRSPNIVECGNFINNVRAQDTIVYIPFRDNSGNLSRTYISFMNAGMFYRDIDIRDLKDLQEVDKNNNN